MYLQLGGLPAHPLLVHATVVLVPLAALLVAGTAIWPRLRRTAGWLPLAVAMVALVLVPLTTHTGEQLRARIPDSALVAKHAEMADGLLPWVLGLVVSAALAAWIGRSHRRAAAAAADSADAASPRRAADGGTTLLTREVTRDSAPRGSHTGTPLRVVAVALALLTATGTIVQVVRIGDSGAQATWSHVPTTARPGTDRG